MKSEAPKPPASTSEQDALWKFAPTGAMWGLVVSPHGIAMAERYMIANQALQAAWPEFGNAFRDFEDNLRRRVGTPHPTLAELGLTRDRGFAAFRTEDESLVLVAPVADRDRFVARLQGTKGADGDVFDDFVCKSIGDRYVCAQKRELFAKLDGAGLDAVRRTADVRGDLEFAARQPGPARVDPGAPDLRVAVVAQVTPGELTVRGAISGVPRAVLDMIGKASRPRAGAASTAGFGVIDLSPYVSNVPRLPLVQGVTLDQLARSIAGPATFVIPAGDADLGLRIPLNDPAPVITALRSCGDIAPLAMMGAKAKDGTCHLTIPRIGLEVAGWIDGNELRIGSRTSGKTISLAPTPFATELAANEWSIAVYGRGSFANLRGLPGAAAMLRSSPIAAALSRTILLVNEIGLAARKDGDAIRFLAGVRTPWASSEDVVQKLIAISSEDLLSGKAEEISASIAAGASGSPFAEDVRAGAGGMVGITVPIAILATVAVPAFMDYMNKSKQAETTPN